MSIAEDVQAILASAIKEDEAHDTTSFYSNGLDAIDQSVLSNRQRLNDTEHIPNDGRQPSSKTTYHSRPSQGEQH